MKIYFLAVIFLCAAPVGALEWTPLGGITALGGLHSFAGDRGSFSGNVEAAFAPALNATEMWAVLPSARASYEGTRRLDDALGTATPAQQWAEIRLGTLAVYRDPASRWRFKPRVSCDVELLRETKDEHWGQGLFDQRRASIGGEIELIADEPHSVRFGADWFQAEFPHYTTLESQAALQYRGQTLARELVGDRVLDRGGYQFALSADAPLGPRAVVEGKVAVVWSRFPHQPIVDVGGQFEERKREDALADAAVTVRMPHDWNADLRALGALELGMTINSSNQNGYDAALGRFLPGFYDFVEWRARPSAALIIGPVRRPVTATLKLGWKRRQYPNRPTQDASGAYGLGSIVSTELSGGLSLSYPMAPRLSLIFDLERASAVSDQDFQQFYRYSYQATTALAGVRWDW